MSPDVFAAKSKYWQIRMMGHRREHLLRQNHSHHVDEIVSKMDDPAKEATGGGRKSRF